MLRGTLYQDDYRPQLSGHETFPLRYGWLKKALDATGESEEQGALRSVFLAEDAIARFGVGKNMVSSMRHWATAAGVIEDSSSAGRPVPTSLGRKVFSSRGLDPYMEDPATAWLVHALAVLWPPAQDDLVLGVQLLFGSIVRARHACPRYRETCEGPWLAPGLDVLSHQKI